MKQAKTIVAILVSLVFAVGFVSAFVLFDPPIKWASRDLPREILVNSSGHSSVTDGDGGVSEIMAALPVWNAAASG